MVTTRVVWKADGIDESGYVFQYDSPRNLVSVQFDIDNDVMNRSFLCNFDPVKLRMKIVEDDTNWVEFTL